MSKKYSRPRTSSVAGGCHIAGNIYKSLHSRRHEGPPAKLSMNPKAVKRRARRATRMAAAFAKRKKEQSWRYEERKK